MKLLGFGDGAQLAIARVEVHITMLGQDDAALSWAREELYLNPNQLQALAIRAAALAQLGRRAEADNAVEALLSNYPTLTGWW